MRKRMASKLHLLSVREVQAAGDGDYTDGGGLTLRVRGASAAWVFRFTSPSGARREMGLGAAYRANPAQAGKSLTDAREGAAAARAQLQQAIDPIAERDRLRAEERAKVAEAKAAKSRQATTLARAARAYHERVIEPKRTGKHAAQWISSLENHVPAEIWHAPIASITAPALLDALLRVRSLEDGKTFVPETLHRIRQRLDAIFEDAIFYGYCATNPAAAIRRKLREARGGRSLGNFKALPYVEAPALMTKLRAAEGIAPRCLEFAVLTAARTSEALGAEWSEFDLERALWTVPGARMKGRKDQRREDHVVHLSARALEIVRGQLGLDERWLFPSPRLDGEQLSSMAMLATLGRLDARDRTTVHGLCRSTFSTWANETGAARPDVVEACLAHEEENRVRAAYNRAQFIAERRELLEAWSQFLSRPVALAVAA